MLYRVIQYRRLETIVEADSLEALDLLVSELDDDDFEVVDWNETVEEA